jgi:hypothetical protein
MRDQGWRTQKTLHELRAYVGSLIYKKDHEQPDYSCATNRST